MKAITVEPKKPGTARCEDAPEPDERDGSVLVGSVNANQRHWYKAAQDLARADRCRAVRGGLTRDGIAPG